MAGFGSVVGNWGTYPYWYVRAPAGVPIYGVVNFADLAIETTSNGNTTASTWYHVIYQLDRDANASLYVNNVLQTDTDDISSHSAVELSNSNTFAIGRPGNHTADNWYHNGLIDAVQVWSKLLTSDERAELYNSGSGWEP